MEDSDQYAPINGDSSYHISETIDKWHYRENKKKVVDDNVDVPIVGSNSSKLPIIIGSAIGALIIILVIVCLVIKKCKKVDPYLNRTYT